MSLKILENEKPLSESPHAAVLRGEFKAGPVAVKRLQFGKKDLIEREIRQLKKLEHKNLVVFKAVFQNRDGTIDVVMNLVELETLGDALENHFHSLEWKYSMAHQISSGLAYLHKNGIVHGNLSPENILFNDLVHRRALIGNYCASVRSHSRPKTPESLLFEPPEKTSSMAGDVYALTLIICCVLMHKRSRTPEELDSSVKAAMKRRDISRSESFSNFLDGGLSTDPEKRPVSELFELTFDLGIPELNYRVSKGARFTDECFKVFVMILTCVIVALLSSDIETLNVRLMELIPDPDPKYD